MSDQHKLMWLFYILIVSVVLVSLELEMELFSSLRSVFTSEEVETDEKYVIMMDAGSSGTRMHIYLFHSNTSGPLSLEAEYKIRSQPGLSAYTEEPNEITLILSGLLGVAQKYIPADQWSDTRLALIATAGLRTISDDDANIVLETVREVFEKSPFLFNNNDAYLLTGAQEGLYAWYGLNFLLDQLKDAADTAALIDLGGQSIQIAFAEDSYDIQTLRIDDLQKLQERSRVLYTKSYLGNGLQNARLSLAQITTDPILFINAIEYNGIVTFGSPCIHPDTEEFWEYDFKRKLVKNQSYEKYGFENCYLKAVAYLDNIIHKPRNLGKREIYALSSHIDRGFELGLIDFQGGNCTVGEFVDTCKFFCNNLMPATTFTCLDCSYISAFWQHGLGLRREKEIQEFNYQMQHIQGVKNPADYLSSVPLRNAVRQVFKKSPFLCNNDSATILEGEEEGIYAWYSLNFLLGRLNDVSHSAISTDLGGQSFEITLSSDGAKTPSADTRNYYLLPKLQQKPISLYTRSYAGFGGVSARLSLMPPSSGYLAIAENNGTYEVLHPCFHPLDKFFWEGNLKKRMIEVNSSELYSFENCYRKATEYLRSSIDLKSIDFGGRDFYGLKGQFDHAYEIGAIDNKNDVCTVGEFVNACRSFCNSYEILSTFTCLDCSYISALWIHGLGLDSKMVIKFAEEIRGIGTGWALGVALSLLQ
nr:ectonucleoside triphosphate diphosphohydrolase 5 [Parasteatoda tepidariorum]